MPNIRRQSTGEATPATGWSFRAACLPLCPPHALRPGSTYLKSRRQLLQAHIACFVCRNELRPQIIRVGTRHYSFAEQFPEPLYYVRFRSSTKNGTLFSVSGGNLGAHEKLTTCALIELTTSKTGLATRHASERIESIRAAFWRSLPIPGYPARAWGFPPRASRVPWLGGLSLSPFVCFPTRFSSFLAQARNSFLPHPARQSRVAAEPETRGTNERLVVNFW